MKYIGDYAQKFIKEHIFHSRKEFEFVFDMKQNDSRVF